MTPPTKTWLLALLAASLLVVALVADGTLLRAVVKTDAEYQLIDASIGGPREGYVRICVNGDCDADAILIAGDLFGGMYIVDLQVHHAGRWWSPAESAATARALGLPTRTAVCR